MGFLNIKLDHSEKKNYHLLTAAGSHARCGIGSEMKFIFPAGFHTKCVRSLCLDRQRRSVSPCDQSPIYQGNDPIASRNLLALIDEANFVEISMLRLGSSFSVESIE